MENNSKWKQDRANEDVLSDFLDKYLYTHERITYKQRIAGNDPLQKQGVDIIISIPILGLEKVKIDEKAATHYINRHLQTFALELSYVIDGQHHDGWFVDENKITDYYAFQWITVNANCLPENIKILYQDSIVYVEYILVSRKKLINYFECKNLPIDELKNIANQIRGGISVDDFNSLLNYEENHFSYSPKGYLEKPINIVVSKKILQELATYSFIITKNGLYQKPNRNNKGGY